MRAYTPQQAKWQTKRAARQPGLIEAPIAASRAGSKKSSGARSASRRTAAINLPPTRTCIVSASE
jgi:hypothetical protein